VPQRVRPNRLADPRAVGGPADDPRGTWMITQGHRCDLIVDPADSGSDVFSVELA